jgi:hypothetical protein
LIDAGLFEGTAPISLLAFDRNDCTVCAQGTDIGYLSEYWNLVQYWKTSGQEEGRDCCPNVSFTNAGSHES